MKEIMLNFNDFSEVDKIYNLLIKELNFEDFFGYNLDALYDSLLDVEENVLFIIKNKELYINLYETILDACNENSNIKIREI